jgi:hypothetical protein
LLVENVIERHDLLTDGHSLLSPRREYVRQSVQRWNPVDRPCTRTYVVKNTCIFLPICWGMKASGIGSVQKTFEHLPTLMLLEGQEDLGVLCT